MTTMMTYNEEVALSDRIHDHIKRLEEEHGIQVIFCVEAGSRLWRMESGDSDYDIRFIYAHDANWYLSIVEPKQDTITFTDGDLDFHGWELRKAMQLAYKSNPTLYEWVSSDIVYTGTTSLYEVGKLYRQYMDLNTLYHAYRGVVKSTWLKYFSNGHLAITKKYFYVLRPLLCMIYISQYNSPPPMNLNVLLGEVNVGVPVKTVIMSLLAEKRSGDEMGMSQRIRLLDTFIKAVMDNLDTLAPPPTVKLDQTRTGPLDAFVRRRVLLATREVRARKEEQG